MRVVLILVVLLGLLAATGCATMTESRAEVRATFARTAQYDMRQLADDCNLVLLLDRPGRLSRWVMR